MPAVALILSAEAAVWCCPVNQWQGQRLGSAALVLLVSNSDFRSSVRAGGTSACARERPISPFSHQLNTKRSESPIGLFHPKVSRSLSWTGYHRVTWLLSLLLRLIIALYCTSLSVTAWVQQKTLRDFSFVWAYVTLFIFKSHQNLHKCKQVNFRREIFNTNFIKVPVVPSSLLVTTATIQLWHAHRWQYSVVSIKMLVCGLDFLHAQLFQNYVCRTGSVEKWDVSNILIVNEKLTIFSYKG